MAIGSPKAHPAQFVVRTSARGSTVHLNGVTIENVKRVSVSNEFDIDDVVRSSITIDLVGEQVLVLDGD